jgi:hypothetical protein
VDVLCIPFIPPFSVKQLAKQEWNRMELAWQEGRLYPAGQQHNPSSLQALFLVERELAREAGEHKITRRRSEAKRIIC